MKKTIKNPNKFIFLISNNEFIFCASHLFIDGIGLLDNISSQILSCSGIKIKYFTYLPLYNEVLSIRELNNASIINGVQILKLDE